MLKYYLKLKGLISSEADRNCCWNCMGKLCQIKNIFWILNGLSTCNLYWEESFFLTVFVLTIYALALTFQLLAFQLIVDFIEFSVKSSGFYNFYNNALHLFFIKYLIHIFFSKIFEINTFVTNWNVIKNCYHLVNWCMQMF